ncbi:MAG: Response regulator receiver protein [Candidatus Gottesmanbacteria bacterium GW2011_GWA2_41_12]|uniref:Response regulator receiver protein n=2 Tax=Candidatus Gottesmaniibacteriota TaxID=1752720 RepID=A0A0G0UHZ3_9BACT|nr:MAG: Response regulator receiver protein [Candidatus Gottesmanbacteria bacterium GW2011_GWC2_39_8]KKR88453.1 MAG: Response regulator receiver protein [Candidatus Gottesmanbacteria bacterium GW2011_GWA2_41_12]
MDKSFDKAQDKPLRYSSIAISGRPGAGRSTLLKNLRTYLKPLDWEFFSGGDWARKYAIESGSHKADDPTHHKATDYGDDIDKQIDITMREKLADKNNHVAVESWIAGWNMRGLPHVLKVLLMCDDALRIDRIVNRENITVEDAKNHIREREETNTTKWKRMYGQDDFWDPKYYDMVINTYSHGPQETLDLVLQALGFYKNNK